jgi:hypothetical protein
MDSRPKDKKDFSAQKTQRDIVILHVSTDDCSKKINAVLCEIITMEFGVSQAFVHFLLCCLLNMLKIKEDASWRFFQ